MALDLGKLHEWIVKEWYLVNQSASQWIGFSPGVRKLVRTPIGLNSGLSLTMICCRS
jgi:hypothetical protein